MVKVTYDHEADALYIYLSGKAKLKETVELSDDPIINLDIDVQGRPAGLEILDARKVVGEDVVKGMKPKLLSKPRLLRQSLSS